MRFKTVFRVFLSLFSIALFSIMLAPNVYAQSDQLTRMTDLDGDGFGDIILHDPSHATFHVRGSSTGGFGKIVVGGAGDTAALGDFNGDNGADLAAFDRTTAIWTILNNGSNSSSSIQFGNPGDIPVPGNYSQTTCTDLATYNSKSAIFRIRDCATNSITQHSVGSPGSVPAPADFDCDGLTDPAVYDPHERRWSIHRSSDAVDQTFVFGLWFDIPMVGDFLGQGCAQPAFYRTTSKHFIVGDSVANNTTPDLALLTQWGLPGDLPFPVNVDGDSKVDYSIVRSSSLTNYINTSSSIFFAVPLGTLSQSSILTTSSLQPPFTGAAPSYLPSNLPTPATTLMSSVYKTKGDYNRDNRADFVLVSVNRSASTTTWSVLHNTGITSTFTLAAPGDALVPADYNGDGRTQPALVYVNPQRPSNANLEWHVLEPSGVETVFAYGQNGQSPMVGDVDCDGKADKILLSSSGGAKMWTIDTTTGDSNIDRAFGFSTDNAYTADINGDGCDELVVSRIQGGGISWFYQGLDEGTEFGPITFTQVDFGLATDSPLTPMDMDGDRRADFLVSRAEGGGVSTYARRSFEGDSPSAFRYNFGLDCDIVIPGEFDGFNYSQMAVYKRSTSTFIVQRFGGTVNAQTFGSGSEVLVRPDGSVLQPGTAGQVCASGGGDDGDGGGGDGGGGSGPLGCTSTSDFQDGGGNALWKPTSESTGKVVILMPSSYQSAETVVYNANNEAVSEPERTSCCSHNGGREHKYLNRTASSLASEPLPLTVQFSFSDGTVDCRTVANPNQRYD